MTKNNPHPATTNLMLSTVGLSTNRLASFARPQHVAKPAKNPSTSRRLLSKADAKRERRRAVMLQSGVPVVPDNAPTQSEALAEMRKHTMKSGVKR
jgi:hypothetical protein